MTASAPTPDLRPFRFAMDALAALCRTKKSQTSRLFSRFAALFHSHVKTIDRPPAVFCRRFKQKSRANQAPERITDLGTPHEISSASRFDGSLAPLFIPRRRFGRCPAHYRTIDNPLNQFIIWHCAIPPQTLVAVESKLASLVRAIAKMIGAGDEWEFCFIKQFCS